MYVGQYVFAQVMDFLPLHVFRGCVARCNGERRSDVSHALINICAWRSRN
jgi:hypothetical protein